MIQHEPLTYKMSCDGWNGSTSGRVYRQDDVLSALEGLKEEREGTQKNNDIYRKSSEDVQNDWLDAIDKWFPIAQNEEKGVLKK